MRRLFYALLAGCAFTFLPQAGLQLSSDWFIARLVEWCSTAIVMPGTILSLAASGGKMDDISFGLANALNLILYSAVAYLLLRFWSRPSAMERWKNK